jgi:hypothetical protein
MKLAGYKLVFVAVGLIGVLLIASQEPKIVQNKCNSVRYS